MSSSSAKFDQVCEAALAQAGELTAAGRDCVIEDLKLRFEYPAQYVAYVDRFKIVGKVRRLTRTILAHSHELEEVQVAIQDCTDEERQSLVVDYVDPPENDLHVPHDITQR